MTFLTEVHPGALDASKNFQTTLPSTRKLIFCLISFASDFSKSETVVGQILQSGIDIIIYISSIKWTSPKSDDATNENVS